MQNLSIITGLVIFLFKSQVSHSQPLGTEKLRQAVDEFTRAYKEVVQQGDSPLNVVNEFSNDRKNAWMTRNLKNEPELHVGGGLATDPLVDKSVVFVILCHEMGHYYGGAPFSMRGRSDRLSWSSSEGQADYYAGSKCVREIFNYLEIEKEIPSNVREHVLSVCSDDRVCQQSTLAAWKTTTFFASVRKERRLPQLDKTDLSRPFRTRLKHSRSQCRLDTFIAGIRCTDKIGVPFDDEDLFVGACSGEGARPPCWFVKSEGASNEL